MKRDDIDELILFASELSRVVHSIQNDLYSTSEDVDENATSLRMYAMHKLIDNINDAVRYLDEDWIAEDAKTPDAKSKKSKVS